MSENPTNTPHKAGFVNIVGKPNVGKSTLMNAVTGEKLSITSSKAQTTRHRIMGMLNGENYQIIYYLISPCCYGICYEYNINIYIYIYI